MKRKRYYIEIPSTHSELAEQDKTELRDVKQWRYKQNHDGRFLERDRVVRSATREAEGQKAVRGDLYCGVLAVILLILWFLLGYALVG